MAAMTRTSTLIVRGLPSRSNSPASQHAEQLRLQVQRQIADLVEEQRRAVRNLESSDLPRQRPGEGALLPAEQLALDEPGRQGGAVDTHHDVIVAGTEPVDGLGDPLLARAGLAQHQDTGVRGRHLLDLAEHLLDAPALPGDLALRSTRADLDLEVVALGLQSVLQLFDLRVRPTQRLLGHATLRDVAKDSEGLHQLDLRRPARSLGRSAESRSPRGLDVDTGTRHRPLPARRCAHGAVPRATRGRHPGAGAPARRPGSEAPSGPAARHRGRGSGRRRRPCPAPQSASKNARAARSTAACSRAAFSRLASSACRRTVMSVEMPVKCAGPPLAQPWADRERRSSAGGRPHGGFGIPRRAAPAGAPTGRWRL